MPVPASRDIHLVTRPKGAPVAANFVLVTADVAAPGDGMVQVRDDMSKRSARFIGGLV